MRIPTLISVFFVGILLTFATTAKAANPGFALNFKFSPAFNAGLPQPPQFFVDVCSDPSCVNVVNSLPLLCTLESVAQNNTISVPMCKLRAVIKRRGADPAVSILSGPSVLRLRANNLVSQSFPFNGAQAVMPEMIYRFQVTQGPGGFSVRAQ